MVSPETARLALVALGAAWRLSAPRRNGLETPESWRVAFGELEDAAHAADGTESAVSAASVERFEWISSTEAARRSGVAERTVRKRLAQGRLPGQKIGRTWCVEWRTGD